MISIELCRKTLNTKDMTYNKEDIIKLRDILYQIGYLDYEFFVRKGGQYAGYSVLESIA